MTRQQPPTRDVTRTAPPVRGAAALVSSISALLLASAIALAQEPETATQEPDSTAEETRPSESGADTDKRANGATDKEVFIPTEEISEDFAVSFPVDI